jgi:hypothetical protein
MSTVHATRFGVEAIQDEAKRLVAAGFVRPSEAIAHLELFFPEREWFGIAQELEVREYQFSDPICDLIGGCQEWRED